MRKLFSGLMAVVFCLVAVAAQAAVTTFNTNVATMPSEDEKILPDESAVPWVPGYIAAERRAAALKAAQMKNPVLPSDVVRRPIPLAVIEPGYEVDIGIPFPACFHDVWVYECTIELRGVRMGPNVDVLRVGVVFDGEPPMYVMSVPPPYRDGPSNLVVVYQSEKARPAQWVKLRFYIAKLYAGPLLDDGDTSTIEGIKVTTASSL